MDASGAVALRKMIQDIASINHSPILYLVYILLSATAPFLNHRGDKEADTINNKHERRSASHYSV